MVCVLWLSFTHSEHRFPAPSSKEGCRKPVLGVCVLHNQVSETLTCLSSLPILMLESFCWWQCSDRYIISLSPSFHIASPLLPVSNKPHGFCWCKATLNTCPHLHDYPQRPVGKRESPGAAWTGRWSRDLTLLVPRSYTYTIFGELDSLLLQLLYLAKRSLVSWTVFCFSCYI